MYKDYKITFGGNEYRLNSNDGGCEGSIFELGADRRMACYAYLYDPEGVNRFGRIVAGPGAFEVDLDSAVDAEDNSKFDRDLDPENAQAALGNMLMFMLADLVDGMDDCGECPACLANEADRKASAS